MIFSNCFRLICTRFPFTITQPASRFSSASFRNFFSPIRKYFDASSIVSVYFSQIGTSVLFIICTPFTVCLMEADRRLWKSSAGISTNLIPMSKTTSGTYHYPVNTGHGGATFPKVALGSLRGSLALFWKGHGVQSPWLAVSQTYLSALFTCQRTTTAVYTPVKAHINTKIYRL